ncbi:hypothetical protein glysoja_036702 [Glycine soja]|uniref:Uncharacterized protein n=1 Tax=Glycine soja TaxID=3848 RepID=A0A0B2P2Y1_GLYSO|nr:hypothetical protein glysoja_036702 [Glycine soja]
MLCTITNSPSPESSLLNLRQQNLPNSLATQSERIRYRRRRSECSGDSKPVREREREKQIITIHRFHSSSSAFDMIERRLGRGSNADLLRC